MKIIFDILVFKKNIVVHCLFSPLLLKISTLHQHLESLNICAERLIDTWKQNENNIIPHLERDLYCYFIQVALVYFSFYLKVSNVPYFNLN